MPTSLVTGSNRGIGLELCRQLHARGDTVIAACRTGSKELGELAALGVRVEADVDVTSDASVDALARRVGKTPIDLLVNNAGIMTMESLDALDVEGIRRQFEVNAIAPLRVTRALLGNLGKGSKVGIVTSRMGSIGDNGSGGFYGYRMSKAAVNAAGVSLARDLAGRGIAVVLLHPGMVKTDMARGHGQVEPADAVRGLLARLGELTLATSGSFLHANGETLPW
jgi:NAD(P)-dependent dehydrogenase (short-subunit alcohol dehydrogenase family)